MLSKFQGGGNGKQMMNTAVEHAANAGARRLLLGVYAKNHKAIRFYEHMGFEVVGTRQFNVGGRDYDDRILSKRINT